MRNADLHCHSHYSDGLESPSELVRIAKKKGIKNIALTDHDSVKGVKEAMKAGKNIGVNVIPGVEIRTYYSEVLGYFIDINNRELISEIKKSCKRTENVVEDWCNHLEKAGFRISFKELKKNYPKADINTFYILYHLHLKGYGTINQVRIKLRRDRKKYNYQIKSAKEISVVKAIRLIRKAGGVAVLAHPWLDPECMKKLKQYKKAGLAGIEINNGDRAPFRPAVYTSKIKAAAKKYKLIMTSGSDYHGQKLVKMMTAGNHDLGANNCDESVVEELRKLSKNARTH